jgi:hypothetical protein
MRQHADSRWTQQNRMLTHGGSERTHRLYLLEVLVIRRVMRRDRQRKSRTIAAMPGVSPFTMVTWCLS